MNDAEIAQETCRRAAALDLNGLANYVVESSDLPSGMSIGGASAATSLHMDLMLRSHLEKCGRWRGRGPACVINSVYLDSLTPIHRRPLFASELGLHELGHSLVERHLEVHRSGDLSPEVIERMTAFMLQANHVNMPSGLQNEAENGIWARAALHLWHRGCIATKQKLDLPHILGPRWGFCASALVEKHRAELMAYVDRPISEFLFD